VQWIIQQTATREKKKAMIGAAKTCQSDGFDPILAVPPQFGNGMSGFPICEAFHDEQVNGFLGHVNGLDCSPGSSPSGQRIAQANHGKLQTRRDNSAAKRPQVRHDAQLDPATEYFGYRIIENLHVDGRD
jgi:hypothetical protein